VEARYLDHYSYIDSPVHRVHASVKVVVALVLVILCLIFPLRWTTFHALVVLLLLVTALVGRIPLLGLVKRLKWVWLVILALSLGRLLQPESDVSRWYLALGTFVAASECLLIMALLANTTRFVDLLAVIAGIGTPRVLVTTLALMYRYLFVLSDEAHRMHRARLSRSFRTDKAWTWWLQSTVIAQLFVRCADRAQRIHSAMTARGWQ